MYTLDIALHQPKVLFPGNDLIDTPNVENVPKYLTIPSVSISLLSSYGFSLLFLLLLQSRMVLVIVICCSHSAHGFVIKDSVFTV